MSEPEPTGESAVAVNSRLLAFYKAEAEHSCAVAERLKGKIRKIENTIRAIEDSIPPEPPVGTQIFVDGEHMCTRTPEGWSSRIDRYLNWDELYKLISTSDERITRILPGEDDNTP